MLLPGTVVNLLCKVPSRQYNVAHKKRQDVFQHRFIFSKTTLFVYKELGESYDNVVKICGNKAF